jgi:hypothetical protein
VGEVRELAESQGGAILSVVSLFDHGWSSAQFIFKKQLANGYLYRGWYLTRPGDENLILLNVVCGERGETGSREAIVTAMLAEAGQIELVRHDELSPVHRATSKDGSRTPTTWTTRDLCFAASRDSEAYDGAVPDHPLTRLRKTLATLRRTLSFPS